MKSFRIRLPSPSALKLIRMSTGQPSFRRPRSNFVVERRTAVGPLWSRPKEGE